MPDSFSQLDLPDAQLSNLESLGYLHMTPIQTRALPDALKGNDLIAQAKTGSGKTAAFALAMLAKLNVSTQHTQALILCPTRELSIQVSTEIRQLARYKQNINLATLYGGQRISLQKQTLKHGAHIVVATDVAARGLDIKDLPLVINYELPPTSDVYIHRTGRTGRAGSTCVAISLCTDRERHKVQAINDGQGSDN